MISSLLADLVLLLHGLFVLFVVAGGLAVLRWPWLAWLHLPAAVWGVLIEFGGWICPLTYLENHWQRLAGESGYSGGCLQHYLEPLLYPLGLTRWSQVIFGVIALFINLAVYAVLFGRLHHKRR